MLVSASQRARALLSRPPTPRRITEISLPVTTVFWCPPTSGTAHINIYLLPGISWLHGRDERPVFYKCGTRVVFSRSSIQAFPPCLPLSLATQTGMKFGAISLGLGLSALASNVLGAVIDNEKREAAATTCTIPVGAQVYDYIVVGAGAGGGPVASRLALAGFKGEHSSLYPPINYNCSAYFPSVKLIDAGHDVMTVNTTVPLYSPRTNEDPSVVLDYTVNLFAPGVTPQVQNWCVSHSYSYSSSLLISYFHFRYRECHNV